MLTGLDRARQRVSYCVGTEVVTCKVGCLGCTYCVSVSIEYLHRYLGILERCSYKSLFHFCKALGTYLPAAQSVPNDRDI